MKLKGFKYEKFDLGTDFSAEDFLYKFGKQSTFPQVLMDNMKIGGMKDTVRFLLEHKMV